jgi:hypothetical protein
MTLVKAELQKVAFDLHRRPSHYTHRSTHRDPEQKVDHLATIPPLPVYPPVHARGKQTDAHGVGALIRRAVRHTSRSC